MYSQDMQNSVQVNDVLNVKQIPVSMNSVFKGSDIHGMGHLKGLEIPSCTHSDEIDLLIGSGVPKAFYQYEAVGDSGQFCGMLTEPNVFLIDHSPNNTDTIPLYLERVFGHDFKDCSLFSSKVGPSIEDKQALELAKSSMTTTDGKFCVGIPWKQNPINLPSNREVALRRLNGLTKRF